MVAAIAGGLSGCVIDATVRPDGWCKLRMIYPLISNQTTVALEKRRFNSAHFRVAALRLRGDGTAKVEAGIDDVTKLSTAQVFRAVTVSRTREGADDRLTATFRNAIPRTVKDEGKPGPRINLTLPAPVREANWNAAVSGNRVTWSFSLVEFLKHPVIDLSVRYAAPAEPARRTSR